MARDPAEIKISAEHCSAICAEIGDRLRIALSELPPVSSNLAQLIARLGELDEHDSPSIVPSIDEASSARVASDTVSSSWLAQRAEPQVAAVSASLARYTDITNATTIEMIPPDAAITAPSTNTSGA